MKIAGIKYKIEYLPPENMEGRLGFADFNRQTIGISTEVTASTKQIAICHETIHMLDRTYMVNLSEEQVIKLTHAIIAFHADNPQIKLGELNENCLD